jgi:hypothetical protein
MATPIGPPALKRDNLSAGSASSWQAVQLCTKLSFNQLSPIIYRGGIYGWDVGRMCLFVRSILWDLNIPQEAATIA